MSNTSTTGTRLNSENPWPGLDSFGEGDTQYFHGRERESAELLRMLGRQPLTVVFGRSGLGKTSLINAGLFPALRERGFVPVYIRLDFSDASPPPCKQALDRLGEETDARHVEAPQRSGSETLWEYFHRVDADFWDAKNRLVTPVLGFDQFEEAFSRGRQSEQGRARCEAFFTELGDLIENRTPQRLKDKLEKTPELIDQFNFGTVKVAVILSFREDYLSDIEVLRATIPSITYNRFRLLPMDGTQAYAVITQTGGDLVDDDLARRIIRLAWKNEPSPPVKREEFAQIEIDPALLSVVCSELNYKRRQTRPPLERMSAALLEGADREILAGFYERSMADLKPGVRAFVEDKLLTDKGLRNSFVWDDAVILPDVTEIALSSLVERRLLRVDDRLGMRRLELTHDVLTSVVKGSRDDRRARDAAEAAARERRRLRRRLISVAGVGAVMCCLAVGFLWQWMDTNRQKVRILSQSLAAASRALLSTQGDLALLLAVEARNVAPTEQANELLLSLDSLIDPHLERYLPLGRLPAGPVAFSPDGKHLVTASLKNMLVWDLATGKLIDVQPTPHEDIVTSTAFSADGKRFGSADRHGRVVLWAVDNGMPMRGSSAKISVKSERLALSPDGKLLLLGGEDGSLTLWDIANRRPYGSPIRHGAAVTSVAFSPDGRLFLSANRDGTLVVWDTDTGAPIGEPLYQRTAVTAAAFSRDGKTVATGCEDGSVRLWDVNTHAEKPRSALAITPAGVTGLAFGADQRLAIGGRDGATILWDFSSATQSLERLTSPEAAVVGLAYSPDGRMLARASGNAVAVFNFSPGAFTRDRLVASGDIISVALSDDGKTLASVGEDGGVQLWNLTNRQEASEMPLPRGESAIGLARDGQGWLVASWVGSDSAGKLVLRRYAASKLTLLWEKSLSERPFVSFSDHGNALAVSTRLNEKQSAVEVVSTPSGQPLRQWTQTGRIALSPDGNVVGLVAADQQSVHIVSVETGERIAQCNTGQVTGPRPWAFSPDGKRLAVVGKAPDAADQWTVVQCQTKSGKVVGKPLQLRVLHDLAFAPPNGTSIATASNTQPFVALWDADTSALKTDLFPSKRYSEDNPMSALAFSRDGSRLAVANGAEVLLADTLPEANSIRACHIANRNLTGGESRAYLGGRDCRKTCPEFDDLCGY